MCIRDSKYTGKSYVVLIGVENQSDIHYAIPVKNIVYDVMAYGNQVKETAKKHRKEKDTATSDEFLAGFTREEMCIRDSQRRRRTLKI